MFERANRQKFALEALCRHSHDIRKKLKLEHGVPLERFLQEQIGRLRQENEDRLRALIQRY